jgi:alpha-glucuronidase
MKLLTLEDYQKAGETFWPKYWYVAKELGEDAKPEDILKVMEAVGGVALKIALEEKEGPFGFLKTNEDGAAIINSVEEAPPGTVAIKTNGQWAAYDL